MGDISIIASTRNGKVYVSKKFPVLLNRTGQAKLTDKFIFSSCEAVLKHIGVYVTNHDYKTTLTQAIYDITEKYIESLGDEIERTNDIPELNSRLYLNKITNEFEAYTYDGIRVHIHHEVLRHKYFGTMRTSEVYAVAQDILEEYDPLAPVGIRAQMNTITKQEEYVANKYVPPNWILNVDVYKKYDRRSPTIHPILRKFLQCVAPNPLERLYMINFVYHAIFGRNQNLLIMYGRRGTGKSILASTIISFLVGAHNTSKAPLSVFTSNFNGFMADKRLVVIEEPNPGSDQDKRKESTNKLKALSDSIVSVEKKGHDSIDVKNFASVVINSNVARDLNVHGDERKYICVQVSDMPLTKYLTQKEIGELIDWFSDNEKEISQVGEQFGEFVREYGSLQGISGTTRISTPTLNKLYVRCLPSWFLNGLGEMYKAIYKGVFEFDEAALGEFFKTKGKGGRTTKTPLALVLEKLEAHTVFNTNRDKEPPYLYGLPHIFGRWDEDLLVFIVNPDCIADIPEDIDPVAMSQADELERSMGLESEEETERKIANRKFVTDTKEAKRLSDLKVFEVMRHFVLGKLLTMGYSRDEIYVELDKYFPLDDKKKEIGPDSFDF